MYSVIINYRLFTYPLPSLNSRAKQTSRLTQVEARLNPNPNAAKRFHRLASFYYRRNELGAARHCLVRAVQLKPNNIDYALDLAYLLAIQDETQSSLDLARSVIHVKPKLSSIYCFVAELFGKNFRFNDGINTLTEGIKIFPKSVPLHDMRATFWLKQSNAKSAIQDWTTCWTLSQDPQFQFAIALCLPAVYQSQSEITTYRHHLSQKLDALLNQPHPSRHQKKWLKLTHFNLAFQGLNDRTLLKKLATCLQGKSTQTRALTTRPKTQPIRIGFVCKYLNAHPVQRVFLPLIIALSTHPQFEITVFGLSSRQTKEEWPKSIQFLSLDPDLAESQILSAQLHILVYPEIGMDSWTYGLAQTRLAQQVCVLAGHPSTTGLSTIDYFISSAYSEPKDAQSHYSEKLITLNCLHGLYAKPKLPTSFLTRSTLGLPKTNTLYCCPVTLIKLHPDFDAIINGILKQDKKGIIVLFETRATDWHLALQNRFKQTCREVLDQILFLPWATSAQFIQILANVDVVLDSFPFGLGHTANTCFALGTPIITLPGEMMRGRLVYAKYKRMDILDCVCNSEADMIQKAIHFATNSKANAQIRKKIRHAHPLLFDNQEIVAEYSRFFESIGRST